MSGAEYGILAVGSVHPLWASGMKGLEGAELNFDKGGLRVTVFIPRPSHGDVEAVRAGDVRLHLGALRSLVFCVVEFVGVLSFDCFYSWHLVPEERRCIPDEVPEGVGLGLTVSLIDSADGVVKALRMFGTGTKWSRVFRRLVIEQSGREFRRDEYDRDLIEVEGRYSSHDLMAAAVIKYKAGEK